MAQPEVGDEVVFKCGWVGNQMRMGLDGKYAFPAKVRKVNDDGSLDLTVYAGLVVDINSPHKNDRWEIDGVFAESEVDRMPPLQEGMPPRFPDRWSST